MSSIGNPVTRTHRPFLHFFRQIAQGGYPLFLAAIAAMIWANLSHSTYHDVWHTDLSFQIGRLTLSKSITHWIDEALMTVFFFIVGLEIKREFLVGGLSEGRKAIIPIMAAIGGMVIPASLYSIINMGHETIKGWGIPMATDIAFSLAILSLLGPRVPYGLKIFLAAFAIVDDLGAVLVIALFYTPTIQWMYLYIAIALVGALYVANLLWIRHTAIYIILGTILWFVILKSGVHATIAGVVTALFIPARGKYDTDTFVKQVKAHLADIENESEPSTKSILMNCTHQNAVIAIDLACRDVETPLQRFEHALQSWVSLFILPLFALASAGLVLRGMDIGTAALHPVTVGILLGLCIGKPAGIALFTWLSVRFLKAELTPGINWPSIIGVSFLGGIGFTMSLFIGGLSFKRPEYLEFAKLGIISGSILCGVIGFLILRLNNRK